MRTVRQALAPMPDFDPGEGWHKTTDQDWSDETDHLTLTFADGRHRQRWQREEPVPPLPAEENTVIRPHWKQGVAHNYTRLLLGGDFVWWRAGAGSWHATSEELLAEIVGFEVLARPVGKVLAEDEDAYYDSDDVRTITETVRRDTAKAVLDRVREYECRADDTQMRKQVAREFGVEVSS